MFIQLDNYLPLSKSSNRVAVIDDINSDASFIIHHCISRAIRRGEKCILISFSHILLHYMSIQKKLGNMRYAKLISFIDCVTKGYLGDDIAMEFPQTSIPPAHALGPEFDLNHLYSLICAEIPDDCGYWVIFDDLSIALALGIADSSSLTRFLIKLRVKLEQTFGSLLILIHKDLLKAEPELEYLVNNVLLKSEFVVETSGLQSGFSKDIDGHVSIYRGYLASVSHESRMKFADFQPQALHYKIYDSDVRIIGKGLSQGFV